ncbi:hypothetical protein CO665_29540 [Rhizobium anhuiense]|uniref:ABC-three component system protein n=1 Tax=Rhizobium anhuiense TaxID=1184720 RepID=UPI000BEACA06|nr:ABC-three component system protein [Rhizobium anhuiense]PDS34698.1 hypothetical protein CO665_29540 [Rhizobium anhuiense]
MILGIGSSIETFKPLKFGKGLNVLLAERDKLSDDKDTRNGSGKSSVIEIVHFLLGGIVGKDSLFKAKALAKASFWGDFSLRGIDFRVERSVADSKRVRVQFTTPGSHGLDAEYDLQGLYASIDAWCRWLGHMMFGYPARPGTPPFDVKHAPTFRSTFGYFARRRGDGGFGEPVKFFKQQSTGDSQIALSYLFGLDWTLALEFEKARDEKREHQVLFNRTKAKQNEHLTTVARLRAAVAVAENAAERQRSDVATFEVEALYEELATEASAAKLQIEKLTLESAVVKTALGHIEKSLEGEKVPDGRDVEQLFAAAGIQLPGTVIKTFDDVRAFHESVISNRRQHLQSELDRNLSRRAHIEAERSALTARRSEILRQLEGKGAFSDLAASTQLLVQREQALANLQSQLTEAVAMESKSGEIKETENKLLGRLRTDLDSRTSAVNAAILAVEEVRQALYSDRYGAFEINAKPNGPEFKVHIDGDRSGGIANMEIFCFDYALFKIVSDRLGGPGFLVHDSHLYDPVDDRQVVTSIELGSKLADATGGQYIVMLNTDVFERLSWSGDFDIRSKIMSPTLTDTDDGGLFGFQFS